MDDCMAAASGKRSSRYLGVTLTIAFVGIWLALLPYPMVILPMMAERIAPADKASVLAHALGIGAIAGLVAQPVFGVLSDHTRSRWGMRKPWILGGMVAGIAAMAVIVGARTPWQLALGWALTALAFNATLSGLNAVIPDQVPREKLGFYSSIVGFTPPVGILVGMWITRRFAPDLVTVAWVQGAFVAATVLGFVVFADDRRLAAGRVTRPDWRMLVSSFWTNPVRHPDFGFAWLSRALVLFGVTSLQTYLLFFLRDRLGLSQQDAPHAMFVSLLVATATMTLSALAFGRLSDRLRRRKPFVIGAGMGLALGLPTLLACDSFAQFIAVVAWIGIAQGAYLSVDLALVTEVLPDRDAAAKDMGVFHLANVVPQIILPLCTPWLTASGGAIRYDALFVAAGVVTALGALAIAFVKSVR
ncbi:major facilitator transporter [Burkholderia aenigmatica]|uniref:Major facilitator transporter n=1 Tax=Burkholderia aenigmatica TaxID=2015348 RepID=A0A6P2S4H2_9BURK|nr:MULTISPECIES: MFS transporter [Burkholderia]VWC40585.1 major facilitator transporter [Burkholderia aenigmatica]